MTDLANTQSDPGGETLLATPDKIVKVRDLFGVDSDMEVPAFSVQFHPESAAGPHDAAPLFQRFVDLMDATREGTADAGGPPPVVGGSTGEKEA